MRTGLSDDLQKTDDARKTAVIDHELQRPDTDIAALQETRVPDSRSLKEEHYTFFWKGKGAKETREHRVGFAIRNTLLHMIEPLMCGTDRILTLRLCTSEGLENLVCIYAPTLQAKSEIKEQFYEQLDSVINTNPASEQIYLMGELNARVGADQESWQNVLGYHCIRKINEHGQRLLELCCYHNLCVTNTYFQNKVCHKASWRRPRSNHWHQWDLVITRRDSLNSVGNTRDTDTNHSLIASKVKLKPKKLHHSKTKCQSGINICKTSYPKQNQEFIEKPEESLSTDQTVCGRQMALPLEHHYNAAIMPYSKKLHKNADWFNLRLTSLC